MAMEQWGFFSGPHLLWHGASVASGYLRGLVTHTYWRAFSSGVVTTWFYVLGLPWLGFEHPTFHMQNTIYKKRRHTSCIKTNYMLYLYMLIMLNQSNRRKWLKLINFMFFPIQRPYCMFHFQVFFVFFFSIITAYVSKERPCWYSPVSSWFSPFYFIIFPKDWTEFLESFQVCSNC